MEILEPWIPHLAGLGGLITGVVVTWFVGRGKFDLLRTRYRERSKAAERAIADLEAGSANLEVEVRQLRHTEAVSLKRQAELEVLARTQQKMVEEKHQLLLQAEQRLAHQFKELSSEALKTTQNEFLRLARSAFDSQQQEATSELEQRRVAVETLVRPVAATLSKVENRIGELEQARKDSEAALNEQVRQMAAAQLGLQKETSQLTQALRQPVGRGRWGELQLKRVVELTGMEKYCEVIETSAAPTPEAPHRPDLIVNLPTGRQIAVDARAPLDAALAAHEATDDDTRAAAFKRHAARISSHLAELASPAYLDQFVTAPEFVVLFLPSESFLSAALSEDASLMERGIEQGVILATPTTLVALLRAAAVGWRQEDIAEKARTVSEVGRELYAHVTSLADHVSRVGQSLDATVQNYNRAIGSLEGTVLPGARQLSDLGLASPAKEISAVPVVERSVRPSRKDLSKLPLATPIDAGPAAGEMPEDSFEGFAGSPAGFEPAPNPAFTFEPAPAPVPIPEPAPDNALDGMTTPRTEAGPGPTPAAGPVAEKPVRKRKPAKAKAKVKVKANSPWKPRAAVTEQPDAVAAAGELRAALEHQKKAG